MGKSAFHILRVGLAITFLWIGLLILKHPESWAGYISPWAVNFLPFSIKEVMISTAVLDIVIGIFLLIDVFTFFAALLAVLHLLIVLIVSGITDITVRDIGLLAASIAITIDSLPKSIMKNLSLKRNKK